MSIRIAVLCPSEIAIRRFMPALSSTSNATYVGVGVANEEEWFGKKDSQNNLSVLEGEKNKATVFLEQFGGKIFNSYNDLLTSPDVDAVYIPLPPGLHYYWAKKALENGKHVFVEKPSTTSLNDTLSLIETAKRHNCALHENYMFVFHNQISAIEDLAKEWIGDLRLIRLAFGFPFRGAKDFRYNKKLGGGALLDCGGYTIKLANKLLGGNAQLSCKQLNTISGFDVDIYGSATMTNSQGQVAQLAFGMDNSYKCELEMWGSKGTVFTNRIFTAPDGYNPTVIVFANGEEKTITLEPDNSFKKSLDYFVKCIADTKTREESFLNMTKQEELIEEFIK